MFVGYLAGDNYVFFAAGAKAWSVSCSRVSPDQPMAVHTCAVPYGTILVGHCGLQITLVVIDLLVSLFTLFSFFIKPLLLIRFPAYAMTCKSLFYWLCNEKYVACRAVLC